MTSLRSLTARASIALTVTASLAAQAHARQGPADADLKEISAYRLTSAALTKVINVNRALIAELRQNPNAQEALKVQAEIALLEKKDELTDAESTRLDELRARQDELEDSIDNPLAGETQSLSDMEARIKKYPPLMQALQAEAMPARDYAKFWMAFIQAAFVQGFKKSGMLKELPPGVNPENVKFLEEHAAEIEAMQKEFEALGRSR
jgi:hypothetical protein